MWRKIKENQLAIFLIFISMLIVSDVVQTWQIQSNYNEMLTKTSSFMKARSSLYC